MTMRTPESPHFPISIVPPSKFSPANPSPLAYSFSAPAQRKKSEPILNQVAGIWPSYQTFRLFLVILLWYSSSSLSNNLGKELLSIFDFPMTLTLCQFGFISLYTWIYAKLFLPSGKKGLVPLTRKILRLVLPLVLFNIVGHSFSSLAISNASVSFVHTVKAVSPFFTVVFSIIFLKLSYSMRTYLSLFPLTFGVILACSSDITFNFLGFIFALASAIVFVAQNIFSKKLFQDGKLDELNLLFYSSFFAFVLMIPVWLWEDLHSLLNLTEEIPSKVLLLLLGNGVATFGQNMFAFTLLTLVTPVTYSIGSLLKRVFIIVTSIIWFKTPVTPANLFGMLLTFTGLWFYTNAKNEKGKRLSNAGLPLTSVPLSPKEGGILQRVDSELVLSYQK